MNDDRRGRVAAVLIFAVLEEDAAPTGCGDEGGGTVLTVGTGFLREGTL